MVETKGMMTGTEMEKKSVVNSLVFISSFTRDVLRLHCPEIANPELFEELELYCKNLVLTRIENHRRVVEDAKARGVTAENLIQRIKHYFSYAELKQTPKMRFTKKEYEEGMSRLSDEEKVKVEKWLEDNGGLDKYIFSGYNAG